MSDYEKIQETIKYYKDLAKISKCELKPRHIDRLEHNLDRRRRDKALSEMGDISNRPVMEQINLFYKATHSYYIEKVLNSPVKLFNAE